MLCQYCNEPLDELIEVSSCIRRERLLLNLYGEIDTEEIDCYDSEDEVLHYECPNCDEIVTYKPEEAIQILKGEK